MTQQTAPVLTPAQRAQRAQDAFERVSNRQSRHFLAGAAIAVSSLLGMAAGAAMYGQAKNDADQENKGLALLCATLALGSVGGEVVRRRLAKDNESLDEIIKDLPKDLKGSRSTTYMINPHTGKYETFGEALKRITALHRFQVAGAVTSGLSSAALAYNAFNNYPVATDALYKLSAQVALPVTIGGAGTLASIAQGVLAATFAGVTVAAVKAAIGSSQSIANIEKNIIAYGVGGSKLTGAKEANLG